MTDHPRRPRFPRPAPPPFVEPEVTRVEEDPVPLTKRAFSPPAAKPDAEPFKMLTGRQPSYVEFSAQLRDFSVKMEGILSSEAAVLGVQRKLAQQMDGLTVTVNTRFNIFHEELALLRQTVTGDHAPRLETVEKTLGQKAQTAAKGGGIAAILLIALPMLADALPKYRHIIETILGLAQ
jgi:hypothetical protein